MRSLKYVVYLDGRKFVARCLNVNVSCSGGTIDEAVRNLGEAVESLLRDNRQQKASFHEIGVALIGETTISA